jgi:nucleoside-diphosphate-sugar epimerase
MKISEKIVILGGCGYLGSKLFSYLMQRGFVVDTVDLEWFGNYSNPKNIKKDFSKLPKSFFNKYSCVILLAGHSTVSMCEKEPLGAFKNNVSNFITLLDKLSNQKLIYASSYRVYTDTKKEIVNESYNHFSNSKVYDLTKVIIDNYIKLSKVKYYGLRMATVNGYSANLRVNQVVNKMFIESIQTKKLSAYNPDASFSILGIDDFCRAIETIINKNGKIGYYNLASFNSSVRRLSTQIQKKVGNIKVVYDNKYLQTQTCRIDNAKFMKEFKFIFSETPKSIIDALALSYNKKTHIVRDSKTLNY